ncbi:MAG: hypothetical protein GY756_07280 [bacterium]|nr:hypothetical protein [bacterium]
MKKLLIKLYTLSSVSMLCYGLTGCVADKTQETKDTHELTLEKAVKSILLNNTTYKTARQNISQANSSYLKSISVQISSNSNLNQKKLQKIKANLKISEKTFHKILTALDKQVKTHGEEYAYNNIKEILIEDTVFTYYKILQYRSDYNKNKGNQIFCNVTIKGIKSKKLNISSDKLSNYEKAEKRAKMRSEEYKILMQINKEKLVKLGLSELVLNSDINFAAVNFTGNTQVSDKDYYIGLYTKLNTDKKLQEEFIKVSECPLIAADEKCVEPSVQSLSDSVVNEKYNKLICSVEKLKKTAKILEEKRLQRDQVRKEYNDGKVDILSLNHAQNELIGAESDYVSSCIDFMKAKTILNFTVGKFSY